MSTSVNLEIPLNSKRFGERQGFRPFWHMKSKRVGCPDSIRSEVPQLIRLLIYQTIEF